VDGVSSIIHFYPPSLFAFLKRFFVAWSSLHAGSLSRRAFETYEAINDAVCKALRKLGAQP